MRHFIQTLPKNIAASFKGKNFLWHIVAMAATALIVLSGLDWHYFIITRSSFNAFFFPAVIIGAVLPFFGLPFMLLFGWLRKSKMTKIIAWTLGQAALIGLFISSFYKALTGRIPPPQTIAVDISHQFNFGLFKDGIFWGWPSSHTTVAFAMAFALITLFPGNNPKSKLIKIFSLIYAFYIGIGVSLSIHWFSEFIAGAIIGAIIGLVVGKSFKSLFV